MSWESLQQDVREGGAGLGSPVRLDAEVVLGTSLGERLLDVARGAEAAGWPLTRDRLLEEAVLAADPYLARGLAAMGVTT